MPRFNKDDYIEVKDRIVLFWERYPEGAITTEVLYVDDHCVRIKACVYERRVVMSDASQIPIGVGHAEEVRITEADIKKDSKKQYEPNATSAVENCETSAVGRALAMAGLAVSKSVASRQEMEKVEREQIRRDNQRKQPEEKVTEKVVDKPAEPAKVEANGEHLDQDEARKAAGRIKGTGVEMSAVQLKLVAMGIENAKTLAGALQVMTKQEAQELESWVKGETKNAGQTT